MKQFFPDQAPKQPPAPEEKTRLARRFCRRAKVTDACFLLSLLSLLLSLFSSGTAFDIIGILLMLAFILGSLLNFFRCPCCGRIAVRGDHLGPFVWRAFECPACWFTPDWGR